MPRAGPLKQILRTLTVAELRSLRRTHCPQVTEYDGNKTAFVDRLRNSLKRSIDDGELTYEDLVEFLRDEFESNGPERATTCIRHTLEDLTISPCAGYRDGRAVRERWISSECYQALQYELADLPYEITQEATFGRSSIDLLVSHAHDDRNYLTEVKLAGNYNSRERLLSQLRKYRKKVPYLRRSFVFMVAERERDLPANKESVEHVIQEAEDEPQTEIVVKPPAGLEYSAG
ncbi:hypothetical protein CHINAEXTREME_20700 (plasmid) [Halobiforma lacisalsi AJ5]|uniref:Uncharacterized protein n=1 Tax=Natronobacterium lacisalsi AJ5 TaxID=358396 RepID=M0LAL5_NATLA|nr:hypothetical protein [Halobiforma lacisalsi]APX00231.1 hypothetical protein CHINAEXTREME_20700 [Halobiforma lacisalsi AJ5]EMA30163.1 hypothetical protein C445_16694 [Halobiforma lacisalsi AJ5]